MSEPEQRTYRVVSVRAGQRRKVVPFATLGAARRRLVLLGPEPWLALGLEPDGIWCCSGHECACDGMSVRKAMEKSRATLPELVGAWIEARPVGPWRKVDE